MAGSGNYHFHLVVALEIRRLGTQRLSRYRFRHNIFQKYLYQSLDDVERAYQHEAVGNTLEVFYGHQAEEIAAELARHFEEAGLLAKAAPYLQQAGYRAVRLPANEEAIAYFYRALSLLETLPETTERFQRELNLQIALFAPLVGAKGYAAPEVGTAYTQARELSERVGEPDQIFQVLYGLWGHNLVLGDMKTALELAMQCLSVAHKIQEPALLMEAHRIMDETLFHRGELIPAREHLEQTLSIYDPQQHFAHASVYGQDPGVASLSHGAWILWHLGYPDQALQMGQEAVTLAEDLFHPFSLAYALCYTAVLHQLRREEKRVEELTKAAITLSTEQGLVFWLAMATVLQGWALGSRGQREEGIGQMRQGLADYRATSTELSRPYLLALLAESYGQMGQAAKGVDLLAEALAVVDKGEERHFEAELYRLKGDMYLTTGTNKGEVEKEILEAIDISRRQEAKSLELRATMSLCRLRQAQGQKEEAHQMLAEIYDWFTEGFETADLKEAKALLEELS